MRGLQFEEKPKAKNFVNIGDVVQNLTRATAITKHNISNLTCDTILIKNTTENIDKKISNIENDIDGLKESSSKILQMLTQIS